MPALNNTFQVAIYDGFLDSFAKIPRKAQKDVNKFLHLFRRDPTSSSLNYEPISTFKDPNLRTVRIGLEYRAIVRKPDKGNVFLLLWVDHHDEAMRWAQNRRVAVHPDTGSLQVYVEEGPPQTVDTPSPVEASVQAPTPLFDAFRDRELRRLGVPEDTLPLIRSLRSELDLEEAAGQLPADAFEALSYLAMGESLDDVHEAMAMSPASSSVDPSDVDASLERPISQARFKVITNDDELAAMIDAPLEKWRVFLHPSQRSLVEGHKNGPTRVLGGPGTGKTVVAMHRAVWLARHAFSRPDDRLLFTTFTRNLATDIAANLKRLAGPEITRRIEVTALDQWVASFLRARGYAYRIAYWGMPGSPLTELWEEAMLRRPHGDGLPGERFYREEWSWVVQDQGCETLRDYTKANRTGRGTPLGRRQRREVWKVFETYRHLLEQHSLREPEDAMRDAADLLSKGEARATYMGILVDESQDLSTNAFRLLRSLIPEERPNDLFLVGDGHQRIYRRRVVLSHAGINVKGRRSRRLRVNYRTTDEIRRLAVAVMEGVEVDDLDDDKDTTQGYRSLFHGHPPTLARCPTFDAEMAAVSHWIQQADDPSRACVVARTHRLLDQVEAALNDAGLPTHRLSRTASDDAADPGVRLATMHRVKGLEFDRVAIVGVNKDTVPLASALATTEDRIVREDTEKIERALLYVAISRARKAVHVSCHDGSGSGLLGWPPP